MNTTQDLKNITVYEFTLWEIVYRTEDRQIMRVWDLYARRN